MAEIETTIQTDTEQDVQTEQPEATEKTEQAQPESAEIARLRAELARQKAATDKASREAADFKKQLRSKQSADEIAAEEKRIEQETLEAELNDLRKKFAVAETTKKVMALGCDETASGKIAEYLYGANDVDAAINELNKIWATREKALKMEYGKVPPPGIGSSDGPLLTKEQLSGMGYKERLDFATKHPEEYNKLMGR